MPFGHGHVLVKIDRLSHMIFFESYEMPGTTMVEMDPEDERFVGGKGGYTMPSNSEELTPGDEEGTSKDEDSDYVVGASDSDEDGRAGSSGWMASELNDDVFTRSLQAIINSGGTDTKSIDEAMENVFVSPDGGEYFQYTNEVGQVLIDAHLVVYHVNSIYQVCVGDGNKSEYTCYHTD